MKLSPLSAYHRWKMEWKAVRSVEEVHLLALNKLQRSKEEQKMIKAIDTVGAIGGVQLSRLFLKNKKRRLKELCRTRVLKKHILTKEKSEIEIYTLGKTSFEYLGEHQHQKENSWFRYNELDVIQRMIFFQLYEKFRNEINVEVLIEKAPYPFVAKLIINSTSFLVLVVRDNENIIKEHLQKITPTERIICVTEHLTNLKSLNDHLNNLSIRVTTDEDLKQLSIKEMFYYWEAILGQWEREINKNKKKVAVKA